MSKKVIEIKFRHSYARDSKFAKKMYKKLNAILGITTNKMIFVDIDEKNIRKALFSAIFLSFLCNYRVHILFSGRGFHLVVPKAFKKPIFKLIYLILYILGIDDRLHSWLAFKRGRVTLRIFGKGISPKYILTVDKFNMYKIM